jgi:hypothetical protein
MKYLRIDAEKQLAKINTKSLNVKWLLRNI